jgi:transposase
MNDSESSAPLADSHTTAPITAHLGVDVSKHKLDIGLLRAGKLKSKVLPNDAAGFAALAQWLSAQGLSLHQVHICMEATGPYSEALALWVSQAGGLVSVVNPARIKGFAMSELSRHKTDAVDAALIARFCAQMSPERWQAPSLAVRQLRALVERIEALKDIRQQEVNRLEAGDATMKPSLHSHISYLDDAIAKLKQQMDDHLDQHPDLKQQSGLLVSIPGLGDTTVAKVLAYAGDVSRFESAGAFAAFIGVIPRIRQSGLHKGRTMMSRSGHAHLRQALYMPGMVALRYNPLIAALGQRLRAKGLSGKAIIGAAMHKLAHLIYGVLKTKQPFRVDWVQMNKEHKTPTQAVSA